VDELTSTRGLRTPFLRVAKDGKVVEPARFTRGGGAGAEIADQVADDRLAELFVDGSTLVLQGLHRTWPPLVGFGGRLAVELGHPVQINAYVTPPQNKGFSAHFDVHDVFVLQVPGGSGSIPGPATARRSSGRPRASRRSTRCSARVTRSTCPAAGCMRPRRSATCPCT